MTNLAREQTNQDVSPPTVLAEMLDDAVGVLRIKRSLERVTEGLRGIGGAVGVGRNRRTRAGKDVFDVGDGLFQGVEDSVLGVHIGRGRHVTWYSSSWSTMSIRAELCRRRRPDSSPLAASPRRN